MQMKGEGNVDKRRYRKHSVFSFDLDFLIFSCPGDLFFSVWFLLSIVDELETCSSCFKLMRSEELRGKGLIYTPISTSTSPMQYLGQSQR